MILATICIIKNMPVSNATIYQKAFECTSAKQCTCLEIRFEVKVTLLDIINSLINAADFHLKKKTCIIYFFKTLGGLKGQHSFHYLLQSLLFSVQMEHFVTHTCHILNNILKSKTDYYTYIVFVYVH